MDILRSLYNHIVDTIFPKNAEILLLERMAKNSTLGNLPGSKPCAEDWIHALFEYRNAHVRSLVWAIKFHGNEILACSVGELLYEEILAYLDEHGLFEGTQWMIVPIPASKKHRNEKGFNQTELLCEAILQFSLPESLSYDPLLLSKIRETIPQTEIKNRSKRMKNIMYTYQVTKPDSVAQKNIILIDDVVTTGSTVREAKRVLKKAGARSVIAFTIAH